MKNHSVDSSFLKQDLHQGVYGPELTLRCDWSQSVERFIRANAIVGLRLSVDTSWSGKTIDFLLDLPELLYLEFENPDVADITPINSLSKLVQLDVRYLSRGGLDLSSMVHLSELLLDWSKHVTVNLRENSLRKIDFNNPSAFNLNALSRQNTLEILTLSNFRSSNLDMLSDLLSLKFLRLAYIRGLNNCSYLKHLKNIEELYIQSCRGFQDISFIGSLPNIKRIYLSNVGDIDTLEPLRGNTSLECFGISDNTQISDGMLSVLDSMPNLRLVHFANRRHYDRKAQDYPKELGWQWMA